VRQGYISRQAARELYAVEVEEDGRVNLEATAQLRAERRTVLAA
jgi:hypothetical protein